MHLAGQFSNDARPVDGRACNTVTMDLGPCLLQFAYWMDSEVVRRVALHPWISPAFLQLGPTAETLHGRRARQEPNILHPQQSSPRLRVV